MDTPSRDYDYAIVNVLVTFWLSLELTLHTGIYAFVLFVGWAAPGGAVQLCHPIDRV